MTNGVEKFQKRQQERAAEIEKLNSELNELMNQKDRLESEINDAIDAGDNGKVEKLVDRQQNINVKIEATRRIIDRKSVQNADLTELVDANNAEMVVYQKRIDQAQAEALKARKAYLSKLLDVAVLVNEAWATRAGYCSMKKGVESPWTVNASNSEFEGVSVRIEWNPQKDRELLQELNPDAVGIMSAATKDRTDIYSGRDNTPRDPGVVITRY